VLVGAERAIDLPVDLLRGFEDPAGVELLVGVREAVVGVVELFDDLTSCSTVA
jgi:hypothetical protein